MRVKQKKHTWVKTSSEWRYQESPAACTRTASHVKTFQSARSRMHRYRSAITFYDPQIWAFRCSSVRHVLQGPALLPRSPSACCAAYLPGGPVGA